MAVPRLSCLMLLCSSVLLAACGEQSLAPPTLGTGEAAPAAAGFHPERLARVDAYLESMVEAGEIAGAQVMLARSGLVVHDEVFGRADLVSGEPVTHDTLWRIYSMTKPVTSIAALLLYEEGHFTLDDALADHLPEFASMTVLSDGEQVPAERPITIRDLFTHSAGLTYGFTNEGVDALYREAQLFEAPTLAELTEQLAQLPLVFEPGSRWHYSVATDVLGRLVEVVSEQPLDAFMRERIFEPLGMVDTFFEVPADKLQRFGTNHRMNPETGTLEVVPDGSLAGIRWQDVTYISGGGGLVSTAADYMRFARMLLEGGALDGVRLLSPKTVAWMTRNHLPPSVDAADGVYGRGDAIGFGLGVAVVENPARFSGVAGSKGEYWWGGAAGTLFWVDPVEEMIGIVMLQRFDSQPIRRRVRILANAALE